MMSFQERAKLGLEQLSKQSPVTLVMARKQAQKLKNAKQFKKQETERLENYISEKKLWISDRGPA